MTTTVFYNDLTAAMALPPLERHQQLARLHAAALRTYQTALDRLTTEAVQRPLPNHSDQRPSPKSLGTSQPGIALPCSQRAIFWPAFTIRA